MAFPKKCAVCGTKFGVTLPSHWTRNREKGTLATWCPVCQQETSEYRPTKADLAQYWAFKLLVIIITGIAYILGFIELVVISALILVCLFIFGGLGVADTRH